MQNMPIGIFRGDDTDAFSYQTIVGTINTDLDLTGCKAVFRYLGFSMEFDPIPDDRKLTIVIPADETKKFPPGLGYASLRVYDSDGRLKTFSNRIMVFVATKTPMFGSDEFEVDFNVRASLGPLKFFVGPNPDDFDEYRGYVEKVIDRASATKYGLAILLDAIDSDLGAADGVAATPVAVKAAYAAIIKKLTDDYYTAEQTDEAIDRVAAYYITYDAAGNPFPTRAALANAQTVYSGGQVRTPTRNDYCVVLADETHDNAEYRYIYAVADGETTGSWQPQFPVEGVMTVDQTVQKGSQNPVSGGGVWSALWGALASLPTGVSSLYDWCVSQLAGKLDKSGGTMTGGLTVPNLTVGSRKTNSAVGVNSVAEGRNNTASGDYSHAEGHSATASGSYSHAEGHSATASGGYSHAEGAATASGGYSHAEGTATADGSYSHAEGNNTTADGSYSHAEGRGTGAQNVAEHAQGIFNVSHKSSDTFGDAGNTLSSIGFGTAASARKNAVETMQDGKTFIYGLGGYDGTNPTSATDLAAAVNARANRAANPTNGNLAALDANGNPTDSTIPAANVALKGDIPYDRITITTGKLQDRAVQKVSLSAASTTLTLPVLTDLTGKVSDFGIDMVNAYEVSDTPTAASFTLAGTIGTDYNLIVPKGDDWSEMTALAAGEMAQFYFTLSSFQLDSKPTWKVVKQVVQKVTIPTVTP